MIDEELQLPQLSKIQKQVIADLVAMPFEAPTVAACVSPEMFNDAHKKAFEFIIDQANSGHAAELDVHILSASLGTKYVCDVIAGQDIEIAATPRQVQEHALILRNAYIRRQCFKEARKLMEDSMREWTSESDLLASVQKIEDGLQKDIKCERTVSMADAINNLGESFTKEETKRVPTGFYKLDKFLLGGMNAGNLVILAARPSVGKTSVALNIARGAATAGANVMLFSLEQTTNELTQKMLISTGYLGSEQFTKEGMNWEAFERGATKIASLPIQINEEATTANEIMSEITIQNRRGKCDVAIIDYLQLMDFDGGAQVPLRDKIGAVTKRLKKLAKSLKIPIVVLSQLNRNPQNENRAPQMSDLRDSGNIEQDADIIMMLERNTVDYPALDIYSSPYINLWLRKNRGGMAGEVRLVLKAEYGYTVFTEQ